MRVISASFTNNFGTVHFEDGTSQDMTYEEYLIFKRNYTPKTVAELTRYVKSRGGFYYAGHDRKYRNVFTDQDYYWFNGKDHLTAKEYPKMMALLKRYQRLAYYIREIKPQWKKVRDISYADNSEYELQKDVWGNTREVMIDGPHGDACY